MIRCYLEGHDRDWDKHLSLFSMALHSTVQRQTGFTPNMLMLGREVIQPVDLMFKPPGGDKVLSPIAWVEKLTASLDKAHTIARERLQGKQHYQKRYYDLKAHEKYFSVGDLVYKRDTAHKVGESSKLKPPYQGPFLVIECRHPLYIIRGKRKKELLHFDRLKECHGEFQPTWLVRARHSLLSPSAPQPEVPVEGESDVDLDATIPYGDPDPSEGVEPPTPSPPPNEGDDNVDPRKNWTPISTPSVGITLLKERP